MKWGIIGALTKEVESIHRALEHCREDRLPFMTFYHGSLGKEEVVVTCCSVGTVNAAACTQMMIDRYGVDLVINTGIAGAMDSRLGVLDVVLSRTVAFHDEDTPILEKYSPFRADFPGDARLIALAEEVLSGMDGVTCVKGKIATGDVFVTDSALKRSIVERLAPQCVEMEGAAVGKVAYLNQVPFLVIRTMSDNADDDGAMTYQQFEEKAAVQSAGIVLGMIRKGLGQDFCGQGSR